MGSLYYILGMISRGSRADAYQELVNVLRKDQKNIEAWSLMALAVDEPKKKMDCYRQILKIDPTNHHARMSLDTMLGSLSSGSPSHMSPFTVHPSTPSLPPAPLQSVPTISDAQKSLRAPGDPDEKMLEVTVVVPVTVAPAPSDQPQPFLENIANEDAMASSYENPVISPDGILIDKQQDIQISSPADLPGLDEVEEKPVDGLFPRIEDSTGSEVNLSSSSRKKRSKEVITKSHGSIKVSFYLIELVVYFSLGVIGTILLVLFSGNMDSPSQTLLPVSIALLVYLIYLVSSSLYLSLSGWFRMAALIGFSIFSGGSFLFTLILGDLLRRLAFRFYRKDTPVPVCFGAPLLKQPKTSTNEQVSKILLTPDAERRLFVWSFLLLASITVFLIAAAWLVFRYFGMRLPLGQGLSMILLFVASSSLVIGIFSMFKLVIKSQETEKGTLERK